MANFKLGDIVKIKDSRTCDLVFEAFNKKEMSKFCGKKAKIVKILGDDFYLDISNTNYFCYYWNDKCFEKINHFIMKTE